MTGPAAGLLAGLTMRGRCLLAGGMAALVSGLALHELNVTRVGVFLLALPVVAELLVTRTRYRLTCSRRLDPVRVPVGSDAQVQVRLTNSARLPTGLMLAEDTVPYLLGGRPRFVLDRLLPGRDLVIDYPLRTVARGRYQVGPLTVRLTDAFGLVELGRSFSASETLVVTPAVVPLPSVPLRGLWAGAGQSTSRAIATSGEDDAATREYRLGDDLRRIHWRSTARRGELMVRREEQPWQTRAALLLDTRAGVHLGDGPLSSFEWAVTAAASIGTQLSREGFAVRLVTDRREEASAAGLGSQSFASTLLDVLAVATPGSGTSLEPGLAALREGGGEELVVAVVGPSTPEDIRGLARLAGRGGCVGVAVVLDTASWTTLSPRATAAAAATFADTCDALREAGWRVVPARRGDDLAQLWRQAASGGVAAREVPA